jgi:hypothetical protein
VVNQPTVTANSATVCAGQTAILTANGANSYVWNGGQTTATINVTPSVTTTYSVTGSVGAGCSGNATATVVINNLPQVSASSNAPGDSVCSGNSVVLSGSGASNYVWTGGVVDGVAFTPSSSQTYTVSGTGANGCVNTAIIVITVNACLGVDLSSSLSDVIVYPSPSSEIIMVRMDKIEGKKLIELFDANGKLVNRVNTNDSFYSFNVQGYS